MVQPEKNKKNDYKVIVAELGSNPFQVIKIAFALMCIIPLLVICYIILGKNFLYDFFLGDSGIEVTIAILVAFTGLLYAYDIVRVMISKLLRYADERRLSDNEKTEVLTSLGNNLKAPVEMLKLGISDLAKDTGQDGADLEKRRACLNAAETISKFVNEMADFEKTGFIRLNVRRELMDLRDIVRTELDSAMEMAQKNRIVLQYAFVTDDANLWGDKKKLSRATMALLSSILKCAPRGGNIDIRISSDADTVKFSVINKAANFSPDGINRIFGKIENADKEPEALEFSVIKDIVDLHNGHIAINSEPGKDTAFSIVLPRDLRTKRGVRRQIQQLQGTPSVTPSYADSSIRMAGAINEMLKDLVCISRAEGVKGESRREYLDMAPLVNNIISSHEREISEKRISIKKEIPQDIGSLWADRHKLNVAIITLLNDAVKNAPSGGNIRIKLEGAENEIHFEISGAGLEAEASESIAVVKHILEMHKGKAWTEESEAGKERKVILILPRDPRMISRAA